MGHRPSPLKRLQDRFWPECPPLDGEYVQWEEFLEIIQCRASHPRARLWRAWHRLAETPWNVWQRVLSLTLWRWQRATRGWSDHDGWDFDRHLGRIVRSYVETQIASGVHSMVCPDGDGWKRCQTYDPSAADYDPACERAAEHWAALLRDMAAGFEDGSSRDEFGFTMDEWRERQKRHARSYRLLGEFGPDLWY